MLAFLKIAEVRLKTQNNRILFFIIILLALICYITILIHQRHENFIISGLVILFSIAIMSVCLDYITPKKALEKIDKENPLKTIK